ncbi:hypothetical protein CFOL_v3_28646 [Cephalotus follicularis]|uniref:Uncharacterized protein n=1 Tax=Cephalotus follicularis TaxID=3775 RepID=A0A1Q3CYP4_CEPFO|nr:hypothetical protein CFOL_v3_28646 [Cephalotus follicularis]
MSFSASPLVVTHKKLKCLKGLLRGLGTRPDSKVKDLRSCLHSVQHALKSGVSDPSVAAKEKELRKEVGQAARMEEAFYKQKSRIQWMKEGDSNTAYFHKMVKVRQSKNHLVRIRDDNGVWVESEEGIAQVAVNYFTNIFGSLNQEAGSYNLSEYDKRITGEQVRTLGSPISRQEVKDAMWSLNPSKAPGSDGYNGFFLQGSLEPGCNTPSPHGVHVALRSVQYIIQWSGLAI